MNLLGIMPVILGVQTQGEKRGQKAVANGNRIQHMPPPPDPPPSYSLPTPFPLPHVFLVYTILSSNPVPRKNMLAQIRENTTFYIFTKEDYKNKKCKQ